MSSDTEYLRVWTRRPRIKHDDKRFSAFNKNSIMYDTTIYFLLQDSTIELPSDFVSVLDINNVNKNATYTCKAVNKLGHVTKSIAVKTKKKTYFDVLELPKGNVIY